MGVGGGQVDGVEPAEGVAEDGDGGVEAEVVEQRDGVGDVSGAAVVGGPVGVAVAPLVGGDDPPRVVQGVGEAA